jgi:hypothetical protein
MASSRIKTKPEEARDQITTAIAGITGAGLLWPTTAPTGAQCTTAKTDLANAIIDADAKEAAWKTANQVRQAKLAISIGYMKRIDEATDGMYGPGGAEKANFGLTPKGASIPPLHKLTDIRVTDGLIAGSIFFDWENIEGASYEVEWFTDSALTQKIGSAASTASEFMISGLTPGTQYWMHVRPHRGGDTAPWSDPATRVAPV